MNCHKFRLAAALLLCLAPCAARALEVYSVSPFYDMEWTFETTAGFQNISYETAKDELTKKIINFNGILFHSYYKKHLVSKAQLNLGFSQKTHFLWSARPNFNQDAELNRNLKCIEFDGQVYLPVAITHFINFAPYGGYSFFDYSYETTISESDGRSFIYNSLVVGLQYFHRINRTFSHTYYASYSPVLRSNASSDTFHYLNVGAEFITDTHPIAITLFASFRRALSHRRLTQIFRDSAYAVNTSEVGFSFHMNLR